MIVRARSGRSMSVNVVANGVVSADRQLGTFPGEQFI